MMVAYHSTINCKCASQMWDLSWHGFQVNYAGKLGLIIRNPVFENLKQNYYHMVFKYY